MNGLQQVMNHLQPIIEARVKRTTLISQKEKMKQGGWDGIQSDWDRRKWN